MQRASFDCTATEFAQQQLAEGQLPGVLLLRFPPLREFLRRHRSSTMASRSSALLRSRNNKCRISSGALPSAMTAAHSAKKDYSNSNLLLSCLATSRCRQWIKGGFTSTSNLAQLPQTSTPSAAGLHGQVIRKAYCNCDPSATPLPVRCIRLSLSCKSRRLPSGL